MIPRRITGVVLLALTCMLLTPTAWAQQASGIAGTVRDTSGAVLPGVTVEATSPVLIEKVRTEPQWRPTEVLGGRLLQVSMEVTF